MLQVCAEEYQLARCSAGTVLCNLMRQTSYRNSTGTVSHVYSSPVPKVAARLLLI